MSTEAVVLHQPGANGGRPLALHTGERRPTSEPAKPLREELAPYMVPSRFVHVDLDALPTDANGKIDRRRLAAEFTVGQRARAAH
ncbi:hypothetical protein ABZY57_23690 [Streptomyces sp. NPDC006450]|uniref:hypothetical protein n=1 Tax=Streptomyces sp. NPDC006450 TaxID=3155458 RepID=UPI0033A041E1